MRKCKCTTIQSILGDGCSICNPTEALRLAEERIGELETLLSEIGDFAHNHSTGPAVPDHLWTVREMAYSAK
jgi:hypothetical protein